MKIAKHFKLHELVDKKTLLLHGVECWNFFSDEAIDMIDGLREFFFSPITVNNWYWKGQFSFRGYRPPSYPIEKSPAGSLHRFGMAFDMDIKGISAAEARTAILADKDHKLLKNIMRMEGNVNWLHVDLKTGKERIYVFT